MSRIILPQHLHSHKVRIRQIADNLNKNWRNKYRPWFSICEVVYAYSYVWGDKKYSWEHHYPILSEFHCIEWKYIDGCAKEIIIENVIGLIDSPYLTYKNGKFALTDDIIINETQQTEKYEYKDSGFISWFGRFFNKFGKK